MAFLGLTPCRSEMELLAFPLTGLSKLEQAMTYRDGMAEDSVSLIVDDSP